MAHAIFEMLQVWNIYLHLPKKVSQNVGKYSSPMEHMGFWTRSHTRAKQYKQWLTTYDLTGKLRTRVQQKSSQRWKMPAESSKKVKALFQGPGKAH